jgi:hypothetical protein
LIEVPVNAAGTITANGTRLRSMMIEVDTVPADAMVTVSVSWMFLAKSELLYLLV